MGNASCCKRGDACQADWQTIVHSACDGLEPGEARRDASALVDLRLLQAADEGDVPGLQKMLLKGAAVDVRRPYWIRPEAHNLAEGELGSSRAAGLTALMRAAQGGHAEACRLLVAHGADANAEDEDGMRPLHFAASAGSAEACRALLEAGADLQAEDDDGHTALALVPQEEVATQAQRLQWQELLAVGPTDPDARGTGQAGSPELF
mmetsp:Transcript_74986/g.242477  ORF Transcript_74986/g.242477 Transcript_74986/m.242477 type:complete len:207 (+) Transcript_74986:126-746(+)